MLVRIEHKGDYTVINTGRTAFKDYYRGSPYIKIILGSLIIGELFKHPLTPIYLVGFVVSYKAYLVGKSWREFYPVYNRETPEYLKEILANAAAAMVTTLKGRAKYNPETFVLEQENVYLLENLSTVSEQDLRNPHVKFFVERNPGWRKVSFHYQRKHVYTITHIQTHIQGHALIVGICVTWIGLILSVKSIMKKVLRLKNRSNSKVQ